MTIQNLKDKLDAAAKRLKEAAKDDDDDNNSEDPGKDPIQPKAESKRPYGYSSAT